MSKDFSDTNSKILEDVVKLIEDARKNIAVDGQDQYLLLLQTLATMTINAFNSESTKHELWLNKIES